MPRPSWDKKPRFGKTTKGAVDPIYAKATAEAAGKAAKKNSTLKKAPPKTKEPKLPDTVKIPDTIMGKVMADDTKSKAVKPKKGGKR